jgi:hypothetical protein
VGLDDQSKGSCIYWPDKRNVTVKRSVIFTTPIVIVDRLEGEDSAEPSTSVKSPSAPELSNISDNAQTEVSTAPTATHIPDSATSHPQRIRKPTQYICDLRKGHGSATGLASRPAIPAGLQTPDTTNARIEGEGHG